MKERIFSIIIKLRYVIPLAIIVLGCKLKLFYYIQTDDYTMNYISEGIMSGKKDEHLIFIKSIIGHLLKWLNSINSDINWFGLLYLGIVLICTYVVMIEFERFTSWQISLIVCVLVEVGILCWLSFTAIAYYCALVSMLLLVSNTINSNNKLKIIVRIILSTFFIILGYAIRDDALLTGLILLLPLLIVYVNRINIKATIIVIMISLICIFLIGMVEKNTYNSELWKSYKEYNTTRSSVLDYPISTYDSNKNGYKKIGYSKNDYECLKGWIFADKTVFSKKNLDYIKEQTEFKNRYELNPIKIVIGMITKKEIILLCIVMAILLFISKKKKYLLIQSIFSLGLIASLFVINRSVLRVYAVICLLSFCAMIYYFLRENKTDSFTNIKKAGLIIMLILETIIIGLHSKMLLDYGNVRKQNIDKYSEELTYINKHNDQLFVVGKMFHILQNESVLDVKKQTTFFNVTDIGDWTLYNNIYYERAKKYHFRNKNKLLLDIAENNNMLFLCSSKMAKKSFNNLKTFIEEHTNKSVSVKKIKVFSKSGDILYDISVD